MNTKQRCNSPSLVSYFKNEDGVIFIAILILIAILAIIGTVAAITTTTDLKISTNYKTGVQAFYAAEAGIHEARERLRNPSTNNYYAGDPDTNNGSWSAYILTDGSWTTASDPDFNAGYYNYIPTATQTTNTNIVANSLQSNISYWVNIRHKKESDLFAAEAYTDNGSGSDDIIYYGYITSSSTTLEQFTTNSPDLSRCAPIEIIRSYGINRNSTKGINVQGKKTPGPPIVAAVYGNSVTIGGSSVTVVGNDNTCGHLKGSSDIVAVGYDTSYTQNGNPTLTSTVSQTMDVGTINCTTYVDALEPSKTVTLTTDKTNYTVGNSSNYEIVYCDATQLTSPSDGKLDMQNTTGYGTLIVKGNVSFSGNLDWYGLIIATGNVEFTGGGANDKNVHGAVLGSNVTQLQGSVNIQYDSCEIENANASYRYVIFRWKDNSFD
ncbi:MAG: hypothetical protein FJ264_11140 [Planctomycetes bacterium]|nr:hypothetical protein [Planctomycetota bacterium]